MTIKRINEFPEGSGSLSNDDVFLFMDDPSGGGVTKKISLSEISAAISGSGSNPFDQNLNTTDFPTFSGISLPNSTTLAQGTFDNSTGGNNGISLNCYVGYELNWQGGHLKSTQDNGITAANILCDSPIEFPGSGVANVQINSSGIIFSDGSTQTTASLSNSSVVNLTFNTTLNTDASAGDIFDVILTDNVTLENPTNPVNGKTIRWRITQDNSGSRTVTLGNKFNIPSSASDPLPWSITADKMDVLAATYHSGRDKWDIIAFVPGY